MKGTQSSDSKPVIHGVAAEGTPTENQKQGVVCWIRCAYRVFPVMHWECEYCASENCMKAIYSGE